MDDLEKDALDSLQQIPEQPKRERNHTKQRRWQQPNERPVRISPQLLHPAHRCLQRLQPEHVQRGPRNPPLARRSFFFRQEQETAGQEDRECPKPRRSLIPVKHFLVVNKK